MNLLFDSFWRAAAYCLHPRVIVLSLVPLALMAALALGLGYFFWQPAVDAVRHAFDSWAVLSTVTGWIESLGWANVTTALAPLVVVFLTSPLIVVLSLLLVVAFMVPSLVELVATRRFPLLERKRGGSMFGSAFGSAWATVAALLALLVSIPLWLVPPLVLILPPLIWGWLTYRVMSYDVLAEHASVDERGALMRRYRSNLLGMGVASGYIGAAPALVFASGALAIVFAPVLVPVAIWIYTLVFAFSALWFAHYTLAALETLRAETEAVQILPPARHGRGDATRADEVAPIALPSDRAAGTRSNPDAPRP